MAANKVKVVNKLGVESYFDLDHWNKIKDSPQWKGVFKVVESPTPPEVINLSKETQNAGKRKKKSTSEEENETENK